jgi:hypothetical protein
MEAMDRLSPENGATEVENILIFWREAKLTRRGQEPISYHLLYV